MTPRPPRLTLFPYTTLFRSTGGSGFIGTNLVRRLLRDGHEVRCLVRPTGRAVPAGTQRFVVQFEQPASLVSCAALERSEEHTSELQSRLHLVCRLLLEKKNI